MSDKNSEPLTLELITTCMNEAARELGTMDPDDPRGAALVAELSQLMQLRRAVRLVNDPLAGQCMDELARENDNAQAGRSSPGADCRGDNAARRCVKTSLAIPLPRYSIYA
jgi:hypothetical protein